MTNPYQAPATIKSSSTHAPAKRSNDLRKLLFSWAIVLLVNLPVPLLFAYAITSDYAMVGAFAGIILFAFAGCAIIYWNRDMGLRLLVGGAFLSLTQFFPIIHMFVGLFAFELAEFLELASPFDDEGGFRLGKIFGTFFVTCATGVALALIAFVIGFVLVAGWRSYRRKTAQPPSEEEAE